MVQVPYNENMSAEQLKQMLALLEPVTFEYPDGQLVHTLAPVAPEYVPAPQFVHTLALLAPATPSPVKVCARRSARETELAAPYARKRAPAALASWR